MSSGRRISVFAVAAFLLTGALSITSLNAPFLLDDGHSIEANPDIRSLKELPHKLVYPLASNRRLERNDPSRPLVYATYALNYAVSGLSPWSYRVFNLLLHALNATLAFALALELLPSATAVYSSAFAALWFLATPVNFGTAIYVYGRTDLFWGSFALAASLCWVSWIRSGKWRALVGVFACFTLGLLSNQAAVTLPFLLILLDLYLALPPTIEAKSPVEASRKKNRRKAEPERVAGRFRWRGMHAALFGVSGIYVALRLAYFGQIGDVMAVGHWDRLEYLKVMPSVVCAYGRLLLLPWGFSIDHAVFPVHDALEVALPLIPFLALGVYFWLKRRKLKEPGIRLQLFGTLWFLLCLAPTSSFFPTTDAMVERRVYLASFGFYVALCWQLSRWLGPRKGASPRSVAMALPVALVVAASGAGSLYRGAIQSDPLRLWEYVLDLYPGNPRAWFNLANTHVARGEFAAALPLYIKTVEAVPRHYLAYYNLGLVYSDPENPARDPQKALQAFQGAISANPGYAPAYFQIARLSLGLGDLARARESLATCLRLAPDFAEARQWFAALPHQ